MNNTTIYFYIDESGDKGYSDSKPCNQIGIMAGFLINDWDVEKFEKKVEIGLQDLHLEPSNKLHMSALEPEQRQKAIELVKRLFREFNLNFFYSVIYTESYASYVGKSTETKKESMHSQLLQNILIKALTLCTKLIEKFKTNITIQIISDNIDAGVIKIMKNDCSRIINLFNGEINKRFITKKQYTESKIINLSPDPRPKNGKLTLEIRVENSPTTFIADVLSYTTFKHLTKYMKENKNEKLNTTKSTSGHPLEEFLMLQYTTDIDDINFEGVVFGPGREN